MKPIPKLRSAAQQRQAGLCYYCGLPMLPRAPGVQLSYTRVPAMLQPTAEHLKARCDGGSDSRDNIVAAHRYCNTQRHQRKRAPQPAEFRALVHSRLAKGRWFNDATLKLLRKLQEELSTAAGGACDEPTAAVGNSLLARGHSVSSLISSSHGCEKARVHGTQPGANGPGG